MSTISSNPLMDFYSPHYGYSIANKKQSSADQFASNVNSNSQGSATGKNTNAAAKNNEPSLFEQGLLAAAKEADTAASSSSKQGEAEPEAPIDKEEFYQKEFMDRLAENGNDLVEAMMHARAETFKHLFEQELERNGGYAQGAIAFASSQVEMSDAELGNVLEDLAKEYADVEDISNALEDAITELNDKMSLRDHAENEKNGTNEKEGTKNKDIADPLMYFLAQNKESFDNRNNKQSASLYESMLAGNTSGKSMNNRSGEPLNIVV